MRNHSLCSSFTPIGALYVVNYHVPWGYLGDTMNNDYYILTIGGASVAATKKCVS